MKMTCPQDQGSSAILLNFRSSLERPMRHKMYMYLLTKRFCYSSSRIKIYQDGASCKEESIIIRVSVSVDADVKCQRIAHFVMYVERTLPIHILYLLSTTMHSIKNHCVTITVNCLQSSSADSISLSRETSISQLNLQLKFQ